MNNAKAGLLSLHNQLFTESNIDRDEKNYTAAYPDHDCFHGLSMLYQ
jgi:hypothetical protein